MKKAILSLFVVFILFSACKKNGQIASNGPTGTAASTIIGTQTWTTVDYNGTGGVSPVSPYNTDAVGKLYTHDEMVKVVPPTGFRIPTRADWEKLFRFLGVTANYTNVGTAGTDHILTATRDQSIKLFSVAGWKYEKGVDTYGFTAIPSALVTTTTSPSDEYEWADYWGNETYYCNINLSSSSKLRSNTSIGSIEYDTSYTSFFSIDKACIRFVKDN